MSPSQSQSRYRGSSSSDKMSKWDIKRSKAEKESKYTYIEPWTPSPYTAFKAFLSARLCAAMWSNISDCDETYNYWEPTHFLLYNSGFQTWEYSPTYAVRSYTYIILHALPGWLYSHLLQSNKVLVFYFLRCLLGLACATSEMYFYKGVCHQFGAHVGRLLLVFQLFSTGMFISSTAYLPSSFSMYFILVAIGSWLLRSYQISIMSVAVATFLGWPFAAVLGFPIAYDIVILQKKYAFFLKWCIVSLIFILVPIVQIDSYFYGKFVVAPLNIVLYNIFTDHGPDIYGVEAWHFYFINGFLNFNLIFIAALFVLPLHVFLTFIIRLPDANKKHAWLSMIPMYLWILIFFTQPHKEERFLFPIYPLICLCGALSFNGSQKLFYYYFKKYLKNYLEYSAIFVALLCVITSLFSIMRILALYRGYNAPMDTYLSIGKLAESEQLEEINLCVGKEWYRFPSNFFLPANWKLKFIQSEFRGQLPKPYSNNPHATSVIPDQMNDQNLEEPSRYVDIKQCQFLIDLDSPIETPLEPRYSRMTNEWKIVSSAPFMDASRSHRFLRSFYIPFLSESRCQYYDYNLLKSKTTKRQIKQKRKSKH